MGQVVELKPHTVVVVLLERDPPNLLRHARPSLRPQDLRADMPIADIDLYRISVMGYRAPARQRRPLEPIHGPQNRPRRALPVPWLRGLLEDHGRQRRPEHLPPRAFGAAGLRG